ncbi:hypothetical protein Mal4_14840 [Maioricimonas rarisocia]|uniref:DUF3618 domain-containing protein n=1 Tax=Maioricimonas rarisocia TaxID=2528026 RepID=A0A517Z415_9PLAN|nr:hypothetical protein [Maioricimonas rarisocia]QDU37175.1 hypothetical protein Mal4_14840 [Maioricimonas rarisocia]
MSTTQAQTDQSGPPPSAYELRNRMEQIRTRLDGDVDGLVSHAQRLADWRYYLRAYPWASLAVVAAVGYFAVPRRVEINSPDAETLERLARKNRLVVKHAPKGEEKKSLAASMANMVGHMMLRAGVAYMGQQAGKVLGHQAAEAPPEKVSQT